MGYLTNNSQLNMAHPYSPYENIWVGWTSRQQAISRVATACRGLLRQPIHQVALLNFRLQLSWSFNIFQPMRIFPVKMVGL